MVPLAPLDSPVKSLLDLPEYVIYSLPICIVPELGKAAALVRVKVVSLSLNVPPSFIVDVVAPITLPPHGPTPQPYPYVCFCGPTFVYTSSVVDPPVDILALAAALDVIVNVLGLGTVLTINFASSKFDALSPVPLGKVTESSKIISPTSNE